MRKVNEEPLIYERDDGSFVLFVAYHLQEEEQQVLEVEGTFDYCRGYYDGLSQITSGISAVDSVTADELAREDAPCRQECASCGGTWEERDLKPIQDYFERVEPGGTVPSGECPKCGALCYPATV
jgi:hypothetical protein